MNCEICPPHNSARFRENIENPIRVIRPAPANFTLLIQGDCIIRHEIAYWGDPNSQLSFGRAFSFKKITSNFQVYFTFSDIESYVQFACVGPACHQHAKLDLKVRRKHKLYLININLSLRHIFVCIGYLCMITYYLEPFNSNTLTAGWY